LEELHNVGHLHRNVKPENFMISTRDNRVRIIDFRLAINYKPDGNLRERGKFGYQGTLAYLSIDNLRGYTSGRKDDLESFGYTIMALIDRNAVPWKNLLSNKEIC
jgi:serine/threonine protein kinase